MCSKPYWRTYKGGWIKKDELTIARIQMLSNCGFSLAERIRIYLKEKGLI